MTAADVSKALQAVATAEKAKASAWFFKTGPGQYGEGDQFIGVTMPEQRLIARSFRSLSLVEVEKLLNSQIHEERSLALMILVYQFQHGDEDTKKTLYDFYIFNRDHINNWDLVDGSAPQIVGAYLEGKDQSILIKLAKADSLWDRRIAIIACLHFIKKGESDLTFEIADLLLNDKHDLIHKAVGWMLREVGKQCHAADCPARLAASAPPVRAQRTKSTSRLRASTLPANSSLCSQLNCGKYLLASYLKTRYRTMPRTMLRYAIEHFSPEERQRYLKGLV